MAMKARYTVVNGEVIAQKRDGVRRFYVPDPLGSTVALLDSSQTKTDTFQYWPYGEVASRTGTTTTPFQYVGTAGYYRDSASRTYVRARELNTSQGRWMTEDPIGFRGRDINLYRYVKNHPLSNVDKTGLAIWPIAVGALIVGLWAVYHCDPCARHWSEVGKKITPEPGCDRPDLYRHCWTACMITALCDPICGMTAILGSELGGVFDWDDVRANFEGYKCGINPINFLAALMSSTQDICDLCCNAKGYLGWWSKYGVLSKSDWI